MMAVAVALEQGDLDSAVQLVMNDVRTSPAALAPRLALFQLSILMGAWERARRQLDTIAELDPEAMPLARAYGAAIDAEAARGEVFAGRASPICLGAPPAWLALLCEALGRPQDAIRHMARYRVLRKNK